MSKVVTSNLDFGGVARCVNHPDPVSLQDVATRAYVLATAALNLAANLNWTGTHNWAGTAQFEGLIRDFTTNQVVSSALPLNITLGAATNHLVITTNGDGEIQSISGASTFGRRVIVMIYGSGTKTIKSSSGSDSAIMCPGLVDFTCGSKSGFVLVGRGAGEGWLVLGPHQSVMAAGTVKLRALGSGTGVPIDGTGAQLGEIIRWTGLEVQSFAAGTHTVTVAATTTWLYINTTGNVVLDAIVRTGGNGGSKLHVLKNNTDSGTLALRYNGTKGINMIHTPFDVDFVAHGIWAGATLEHNGFEWFIPDAKTGAAESFVGNFGTVAGTVNSRLGTDVAGAFLKYLTGGTLTLSDAAAGAVKPQDNQNWVSLAPGNYTGWAISATQHLIAVDPNGGDVNINSFIVTGGNAGSWFRIVKRGSDGRVVLRHQSATETTATNRTICPGAIDYILSADGDAVDVHYIDDTIASSGTPGSSARFQVIDRVTPGGIVSVSGTQNALALGGASVIECTTTTTINGIAGGFRGRVVDIIAATGNLIAVNHVSASAAASDQIALPGSVDFIGNRIGLRLVHDGTLWRSGSTAPAPGVLASNVTFASVTNATTPLSCGSVTLPANSPRLGSIYRFSAYVTFTHTAAATPVVQFSFKLNGVSVFNLLATPLASARKYHGEIRGLVAVTAIGASGSLNMTLKNDNDWGADTKSALGGAQLSQAIDTTVDNTLEITAHMQTAVASNTLDVHMSYVERIT
jgi:hypothetical protein